MITKSFVLLKIIINFILSINNNTRKTLNIINVSNGNNDIRLLNII